MRMWSGGLTWRHLMKRSLEVASHSLQRCWADQVKEVLDLHSIDDRCSRGQRACKGRVRIIEGRTKACPGPVLQE